jgi:predicted O-methyltransferase YrrM
MFIEGYAGMDNPGPALVRSELARVDFRGGLEFVLGDSHKVLPAYFREHPEVYFDLITVDGDHSEAGARADLATVLPRLKVGGALVFDDIAHVVHPELAGVAGHARDRTSARSPPRTGIRRWLCDPP